MIITLLGRQPALGIAELERVYGSEAVSWFSDQTALVDAGALSVEQFGGIQKAGRVVAELPGDWQNVSKKIVHAYTEAWSGRDGKITLGISAYGFARLSPRDVQKTGLVLKARLKKSGVSLRLIPNSEPALNSATAHHNKLGLADNKIELLVVKSSSGKIIIAESCGAQNITSLAARDQGRPKRDAFVGMLPPKLALQMVNLAVGGMAIQTQTQLLSKDRGKRVTRDGAIPLNRAERVKEGWLERQDPRDSDLRADFAVQNQTTGAGRSKETDVNWIPDQVGNNNVASTGFPIKSGMTATSPLTVLDPFCGTGVILQEALLRRYRAYGTDLSAKMIDYSQANLAWLKEKYHLNGEWLLSEGDAMTTKWRPPIDAVACESYLGQPFSASPSPPKLKEVRRNCDYIISSFLKNLAAQIPSGTPLCVAVPAWRDTRGNFTHLPLIDHLNSLGYEHVAFKNITDDQLLYYRENQVVARKLLVITRK